MDISLIATLIKRLAAVCLASVVVWHVAQHAGRKQGRAIVHVSQPDVMVEVDDRTFHVGSLKHSPVICDLDPGPHRAEGWRNGRLIGERRFEVEAGREVVVRPSAIAESAAAREPIRSDLAVRTNSPEPARTRN